MVIIVNLIIEPKVVVTVLVVISKKPKVILVEVRAAIPPLPEIGAIIKVISMVAALVRWRAIQGKRK